MTARRMGVLLFVLLLGGCLRLAGEDNRYDETALGRGVLDIIADQLAIFAEIEIDVRLDRASPLRRQRPRLDIEAVCRPVRRVGIGSRVTGVTA